MTTHEQDLADLREACDLASRDQLKSHELQRFVRLCDLLGYEPEWLQAFVRECECWSHRPEGAPLGFLLGSDACALNSPRRVR